MKIYKIFNNDFEATLWMDRNCFNCSNNAICHIKKKLVPTGDHVLEITIDVVVFTGYQSTADSNRVELSHLCNYKNKPLRRQSSLQTLLF